MLGLHPFLAVGLACLTALVASDYTCSFETDTDYPGNDFGHLPGTQASDCCSKCAQLTSCSAFSWSNYNGGTCWFKTGKSGSSASTGVVSGTISGQPARTHVQYKIRTGEIPARAVNLGGWLVVESWMNKNDLMWQYADNAQVGLLGEYRTTEYLVNKIGRKATNLLFEHHRTTWITEQDIQAIAAAGLNTVRVPVGYWIVDDVDPAGATDQSRMFAPGGLYYLDLLINDWAAKYNIAVVVSLHAHLGSQNGYDHSAPMQLEHITWSDSQSNMDNSLRLATIIAARYKSSPAFLGMNIMNEPRDPTNIDFLKQYYVKAYTQIRNTANDCVIVVPPLIGQQGSQALMDFMRYPDYFNVWVEWHPYFKWGYDGLSQQQLLDAMRNYRANTIDKWSGNYLFLSEWSLGHPDEKWYTDLDFLRNMSRIQLDQFSGAHAGWAFWSWKNHNDSGNASTWALNHLLQEKIVQLN